MTKNTIKIGSVDYTMKDLKESLNVSNEEAKRYLEELIELRKANKELKDKLIIARKNATMIGILLGFIEPK